MVRHILVRTQKLNFLRGSLSPFGTTMTKRMLAACNQREIGWSRALEQLQMSREGSSLTFVPLITITAQEGKKKTTTTTRVMF